MRRFVRIMAIVLLLLAAGLLAATVGVVMPRSFRVVGPDGAPAEAWVAFVYEGARLNLVHPTSWKHQGGIVEANAEGVIRLPMLVYLKAPLDGWLRHEIGLIYAPALHAARHDYGSGQGAVLSMPDNRDDPQAWDYALGEIYSLVVYGIAFAQDGQYGNVPETVTKLTRQVVEDYRSLLETHGERRREIPGEIPGHLQFASEEDQAEWREQMRREIEREPTWGIHLEHRYASRIAKLQDRFGL